MKKLLLIVLLIVGWVFTEDEYPYFSDANKQLEFEKKKISIGLLSGNISIDDKKIEMDEFFGIIGLVEDQQKVKKMNEVALEEYNASMEEYIISMEKWNIDLMSFINENEENIKMYKADSTKYKREVKMINDTYEIGVRKNEVREWGSFLIGLGSAGIWTITLSDVNSPSTLYLTIVCGGFIASYWYGMFGEDKSWKEKNIALGKINSPRRMDYYNTHMPVSPIEPTYPYIDYGYSLETLMNLAESYNRKVYEGMVVPK